VVQAVGTTQDEMIALFERIENFFRRPEMYIGLPRTTGMMEIIVKGPKYSSSLVLRQGKLNKGK
jgi:hypothetical protein